MSYVPHPHHRSLEFASQKSQWTITTDDECACYSWAIQQNWLSNGFYWGLHKESHQPTLLQLGISKSPEEYSLHIAKFVASDGGEWHGYPVAHWLSTKDKPGTEVLKSWLNSGLINKPKMAKIKRGKKCDLSA